MRERCACGAEFESNNRGHLDDLAAWRERHRLVCSKMSDFSIDPQSLGGSG